MEALRLCPIITKVCRELEIPYRAVTAYRRADPEFGREIDDARAEGWDRIEEQAFEEAIAGGFRSHKLIEFLLKGRKRHVYGDRLDVRSSHQHEVVINLIPPGGTVPDALAAGGRHADILEGELIEDGDDG